MLILGKVLIVPIIFFQEEVMRTSKQGPEVAGAGGQEAVALEGKADAGNDIQAQAQVPEEAKAVNATESGRGEKRIKKEGSDDHEMRMALRKKPGPQGQKKIEHSKLRCHYCRRRDTGVSYLICAKYPACRCGFCYKCLKEVFGVNGVKLRSEKWVCFVCHHACQCDRCKNPPPVPENPPPPTPVLVPTPPPPVPFGGGETLAVSDWRNVAFLENETNFKGPKSYAKAKHRQSKPEERSKHSRQDIKCPPSQSESSDYLPDTKSLVQQRMKDSMKKGHSGQKKGGGKKAKDESGSDSSASLPVATSMKDKGKAGNHGRGEGSAGNRPLASSSKKDITLLEPSQGEGKGKGKGAGNGGGNENGNGNGNGNGHNNGNSAFQIAAMAPRLPFQTLGTDFYKYMPGSYFYTSMSAGGQHSMKSEGAAAAMGKGGDNPRSAFVEPSSSYMIPSAIPPHMSGMQGPCPDVGPSGVSAVVGGPGASGGPGALGVAGTVGAEAGRGAYGMPAGASNQSAMYASYAYPNADKDYAYPPNPYGQIDMGPMMASNYAYYPYTDPNYFSGMSAMPPEAYAPYMWPPPPSGMPARPPEAGPSNGQEQHDEGRPVKQDK